MLRYVGFSAAPSERIDTTMSRTEMNLIIIKHFFFYSAPFPVLKTSSKHLLAGGGSTVDAEIKIPFVRNPKQ